MYSEKPKLHVRQKAHKQGNLRTIALDVTSKCNFNCSHCYAETFSNVDLVDIETLGRVLQEAYQMGVYHYILQGGEPLTDPNRLEAIITMIHPDETYINVVSNGWEMTRDKIKWLKNLKVDKIAFSLDSGIEEEHDLNRRQGSYARVLEAIENVFSEGLLASISTVVTRESLYSEGFKTAYEFALKKGIRIDVQIAMPVGKWDGKKDCLITYEDSKYIKHLQLTCPILSNGQRMISRDIFSGECDHCPAGTEFMAITANGHVLPCNFLQYSLGSIREKSLGEMRYALLKSNWFDGKHPECIGGQDCEFIDTFIMPYVGQPKPLDAYKVFNLGVGEQND